jgi:N6-L-threonylcarbamoyladenine synthase
VVEVAVREVEELRPALEALTEELAERERISEEPDKVLTLAIETSCDETSVAILSGEREVLSNVISSSAALHEKYGGVVPEIASRAQVEAINPALSEALRQADATFWDLAVVTVTLGPGLIGSLIVGVEAAKTLAAVLDVPLVGVNHLEAHLYSNLIEQEEAAPPAVGLIVSGGHTMLVHMIDHGLYEILGQTFDDAAGEAFDKVARYLGLGFPGGPAIDAEARKGDLDVIAFPRAMLETGFDFSFSGLKTAVLRHISRERDSGREPKVADVCASFQEAVADVLSLKTVRAATEVGVTKVLLSGGVAANSRLRELLSQRCEEAGLTLFHPSPQYCTDNAAMVAVCGHQRYVRGARDGLDLRPDPNLPLA